MARLISSGNRTGKSKTYETEVTCGSCGNKMSSLAINCPHCGNVRKVHYAANEVKRTGKVLEGEELARVKAGAKPCQWCSTLTWNFDLASNGYDCNQCGGGTGQKSDYELAGGQPDQQESVAQFPTNIPDKAVTYEQPSTNIPWKLIAGIGSAVLGTLLIIWLLIGLFTTHEVPGKVTSVSWERKAHQEEYRPLDGEGFELPFNATQVGTPESKFYKNQPNVIGKTHGTYYATSTPKVVDITYSTIDMETPGAIYTSEPYDCGDPTPEAGGSVSYDQCSDTYQEDSTWGKGKSTPTYEYAPKVDVKMTTLPTDVYGTPTPIYKDYYRYVYWQWVNTGDLPRTSGNDNKAYWPSGQTDDLHRVVNDSQSYKVVVRYENGHTETYESSDPNLLLKYILNTKVIGYFNTFGGLNGDNK